MRNYLIMSHGRLAMGIQDTLQMFLGKRDDIKIITAYTNDKSLTELISEYFKTLGSESELIIFTDILGGSVNQEMMKCLKRPKTHIISGYNLPLVLEIIAKPVQEEFTKEKIKEVITVARNQMVYVNDFKPDINEDDEI